VDTFCLFLETSVETRKVANCFVEIRALCTLDFFFFGRRLFGLKSAVRQLHAADCLEEAWGGN